MSNARKCDRCGICFDPLGGPADAQMISFQNPSFLTAESIKKNKRTKLLIEDASLDTYVDLCPSCTNDFERFMKCDPPLESYKLMDENDQLRDEVKKLINEIDSYREQLRKFESLESSKVTYKTHYIHPKRKYSGDYISPDLNNITFDSYLDAKRAYDCLRACINSYAVVTICDLYDIIGRPSNYMDSCYGWHNLDEMTIKDMNPGSWKHKWKLVLPKPIYLEDDCCACEAGGDDTDGDN